MPFPVDIRFTSEMFYVPYKSLLYVYMKLNNQITRTAVHGLSHLLSHAYRQIDRTQYFRKIQEVNIKSKISKMIFLQISQKCLSGNCGNILGESLDNSRKNWKHVKEVLRVGFCKIGDQIFL